VVKKIPTKGITRKMEGRVVVGTLPIFPLRATPRNSGVTAGLSVLAERTQATKQGQVLGVNRYTVMKLSMCAHSDNV
jgi:hypothetical protein